MVKKTKTIRVLLLCTLIIIILIWAGNGIREGLRDIAKDSLNDLPTTQLIMSEDSTLISRKYIGKLKAHENINNKLRAPVSFLYVDDTFHLAIFKIDLVENISLQNALQMSFKSVDRSTGEVYRIIEFNNFSRFQWRQTPAKPVSKIYFTLAGDSLQNVITSDSIISYHLLCNNFSVKFDENGPLDVYMVGMDKGLGITEITPSDLLFLKRGNAVYLMVLTSSSPKSAIPPKLLYNLVVGV